MTNHTDKEYLILLMKNIRKPSNGKWQKVYNKAKHSTAYRIRPSNGLTRSKIRTTRTEAIQAAKLLRKHLKMKSITKPVEIINMNSYISVNLTKSQKPKKKNNIIVIN